MKAKCCFVLSRKVIDSRLGEIRFFFIPGLFSWYFLRLHVFYKEMFILLKKVILMIIFRFLSDLHLHSLCKCKWQCFRIGNLTLTIFRWELIKVELFLNLIDIKGSLEKNWASAKLNGNWKGKLNFVYQK